MEARPPKALFIYLFISLFVVLPSTALAGPGKKPKKTGNPHSIGRATLPDSSYPKRSFASPTFTPEISGRAALALIDFPWQELGYTVSFLGRRPGYRALTFVDENRIEIYVKEEETPQLLAFDLAHEFGHLIDLRFNNQERRERWMKLRGIDPATPWYGPSGCSDYETPAGDFAETFAYLLLGPGSFHSRMAPPPRPEQIAELAEFCRINKISTVLKAAR